MPRNPDTYVAAAVHDLLGDQGQALDLVRQRRLRAVVDARAAQREFEAEPARAQPLLRLLEFFDVGDGLARRAAEDDDDGSAASRRRRVRRVETRRKKPRNVAAPVEVPIKTSPAFGSEGRTIDLPIGPFKCNCEPLGIVCKKLEVTPTSRTHSASCEPRFGRDRVQAALLVRVYPSRRCRAGARRRTGPRRRAATSRARRARSARSPRAYP